MSYRDTSPKEEPRGPARRVLIISYHFPPDGAMGAVRAAKFAKYLPEFGWKPVVYTLKEQYYETRDYTRLEPVLKSIPVHRGTLIPGPLQSYSRVKGLMTGSRSGPHTIPTKAEKWHTPGANMAGRMKRLVSALLRLPDEEQGWIVNAAIGGLRLAQKYKVAAFVTSGPPMSTHLGGLLLKKATGIRWIADFRDPWIASPWQKIRPHTSFTHAMDKRLESWVVRNADIIVSTTASATAYFKSVLPPEEQNKCLTITNGFDDDDFGSLGEVRPQTGSKIKIIYAGSLYLNRNPEPFFAALGRLVSTGQVSENQVDIELIGSCLSFRGASVLGLAAQYGVQNMVRILDTIPYHECLDKMIGASGLLLLAQGQPDQIPGKVFDYFRINRPILAIAEEGETSKALKPFANAFVADPENMEDIAEKLLNFLKAINDGVRCLDIAGSLEKYSRRELARQLSGCLTG
jgi:glycosyltransferase involved in cell wall biosynthesis